MASPRPKRPGTSSPTRERVSTHSRDLLVRLSQLPPLVVPVAVLVLMLLGLMAPLYAAVPALVVVAAFVSWLAYLSWPVLDSRGRLLRGVMLGAVAAALVGRITGWL
jgi:hypothetical protein